ncbi:pseudouridine synthase [Nemorincola caseinilytica]|uniref:Pseudouridine synthase n=1 Tax=Nemorincola caseinilytica TaxID=2054315 RepID=A0ABP8NNQ4_9BACT
MNKRTSTGPGAPKKGYKANNDRPAASFDKKPFKRRDDGGQERDERPFRKRADDNDRPFDRKPARRDDDNRGDREERPFRRREESDKPYGRKPARRDDDNRGDREERPFRKREDGDKPYGRKPARRDDDNRGDREERPFRRREDGDKPYGRKPARRDDDSRDDREERPFRKREDGDKPYGRKPARRDDDSRGDREERPFRKREIGDKPYGRKPARRDDDSRGDREERPFRKREDGDKPYGKEKGPVRFRDNDPFKEERPLKEGEEKPKKTGVTFSKGLEEVPPFMKPKRRGKPGADDSMDREERPFRERRDSGSRDSKPGKKPADKPFAGMPERKKSKEDHKKENRYTEREEYEMAARQNDREYFGDDAEWRPTNDTRKQVTSAASYPMPLNKYIAHSGECSRRDAAEMVKQGKVKVNGELVLEPGHKVEKDDKVTLGGKKLTPQKGLIYVLLNKPKGFITTNEDERGRKTVMDLVANADASRLFPIGRLDRATTGLLLLTNDGMLTQKLSHPSYEVKKVYHVTLDKPLTKAHFEQVMAGLELEDGKAEVDEMAYLEQKNELGLEIHSGKNRIVRRIFESLGYVVEKLDRVVYAGLTKKNLPRGKWRYLNEEEIRLLKHFKS